MSDDRTPSELNLDDLGLDDDDDGLDTLAALSDEVRAPLITPADERFPPLKPPASPPSTEQATASDTAPETARSGRAIFYNGVTALSFLGIGLVVVWLALVWQNPQAGYNPFAPPTPFVQITATPGGNSAAAPPLPTANQQGQIVIVATETPLPQAASTAYEFAPAQSGVDYIANPNSRACKWASIAGEVTDSSGNGLSGYRVRVTGDDFRETVFSGSAPLFGTGGYDVQLAAEPVAQTFRVQLLNPQGAALSDAVTVTTRATCDANVAQVDFIQVQP
jgi:hypothetical protein